MPLNIKVKSKVNIFSFLSISLYMYYRWFKSTFDDFTFNSLKRTCSDVLIFEKLPFLLTQLSKKCGSCQLVIRVINNNYLLRPINFFNFKYFSISMLFVQLFCLLSD